MTEQFDEQGRPTRVKVMAHDYEVRWMDTVDWRASDGSRGICDNHFMVISVWDALPPTRMATTFLHEVIHAIHAGGPLYGESDNISEEQMASGIAMGQVAFWRDNPQTFRWWSELLNA